MCFDTIMAKTALFVNIFMNRTTRLRLDVPTMNLSTWILFVELLQKFATVDKESVAA
jgi:hypothetical protein